LEFQGEFYTKENYAYKMTHHLGLVPNTVIKEYQYKVLLTDLDHNCHLNNARYLDIIYNSGIYKGRGYFKDVEIAFIHEAKLDDIINLKYYKNENGKDCFVGYVNDEVIFEAVLTMEE
jgi:acyl-ACP thioesterase